MRQNPRKTEQFLAWSGHDGEKLTSWKIGNCTESQLHCRSTGNCTKTVIHFGEGWHGDLIRLQQLRLPLQVPGLVSEGQNPPQGFHRRLQGSPECVQGEFKSCACFHIVSNWDMKNPVTWIKVMCWKWMSCPCNFKLSLRHSPLASLEAWSESAMVNNHDQRQLKHCRNSVMFVSLKNINK